MSEDVSEAEEFLAKLDKDDLDRLERMILRRVAREYFLLDEGPHGDD